MQATPIDLLTIISAFPVWLWLVVALFMLILLGRFGSMIWRSSKADDYVFARNVDLVAEVAKLTSHKAQLIAWATKAVRHFGGCSGCVLMKQEASRDDLEHEFNEMMKGMT